MCTCILLAQSTLAYKQAHGKNEGLVKDRLTRMSRMKRFLEGNMYNFANVTF